jgi:hypothetical protein
MLVQFFTVYFFVAYCIFIMKFSSLTLFLILLIVLVISVLCCRQNNIEEEGFISYNLNGESLSQYEMLMYSEKNKLILLYDNVYFDYKNGNLVEIDGTDNGAVPEVNNTDSVNNIYVTPRGGSSTIQYSVAANIGMTKEPSQTMSNSYKSYIYYTKCVDTSKYAVCMIPWHNNTYIHMINTSEEIPTNLSTYIFSGQSIAPMKWDNFPTGHENMGEITESRDDTNKNNNKFIIEPTYNTERKVYQISEFIKYDVSNSSLLVSAGEDVIVYDRDSSITTLSAVDPENTNAVIRTGDGDSVATANFSSRIIYDLCGQNMVVYVPNAKKTLVALICYDDDNKIDLRNVCRFNEKGIDTGEPEVDSGDDNDDSDDSDDSDSNDEHGKRKHGNHNHGYSGYDNSNFYEKSMDMNDYLLKSQIVPPVCPSCPSCNSNVDGACNQCGGTGGCGAKDISGNSLVQGNGIRDVISETSKLVGHTFDAAGNILTGVVNTTGNVADNTVDTAGNIINNTVTTAGNVAGNTFDAAGNVISGVGKAAGGTLDAAGNIVGGTVDAVGNVIGGVFGAAGNVIGGAVDAVGNAGGSTGGSLNGSPQMAQNGSPQMAQNGSPQMAQNGSPQNDPYSYSGQLSNRPPTNFVPRTADFSTFGK